METGSVKFWKEQAGFGFIAPSDGSADIFLHRRALPEGIEVREGDRIEFTVGRRDQGLYAIEARLS